MKYFLRALKGTLFGSDVPSLMATVNVSAFVLLAVSVVSGIVQVVFFTYPTRCWFGIPCDFVAQHGWRRNYIEIVNLTLISTWLLGTVLALGVDGVGFVRSVRGTQRWETFSSWLYIHWTLFVLAFLAAMSWSGVAE